MIIMFIRNAAVLARLCEQAKAEGSLALDVEFIREHTYVPQLALIQIAVSDTCAIVDPLAVPDLSPLLELISSPQTLKVLHAASQDLEVLYWQADDPPAAIFDTQIAAAMVGLGEQLSYGHLVERLLGVSLPKGESYSAWLQRPLTPDQVQYALDDVRYLPALHRLLVESLAAMGRTDWAAEECRKFADRQRYQRNPRTLFRRIRRGRTLAPQGQAILRELAAWRDQEAQERNRPPGSVLNDEQLVDIARKAPCTPDDLQRLRGLSAQKIARSGAALLAVVQCGLAVTENERPHPVRGHRLSHTEKVAVTFLDACLKALCTRHKLPPSAIASRADLEALVHRHQQGRLATTEHPLLEGWRGELVGQDLLAVLEGRVSVFLDPATGQVAFTRRSP